MSHDIVFDPPDYLETIHMTSPYAATTPASPTPVSTPSAKPPRRRGGRPKGPPKQPPEAAASSQARRTATVLLEVLAGLRTTGDAARTLGVTPVRFYHIEERAIGGLISACEPRPSGLQPAAREAHELERLREQVRRQGMELNQVRSVLRTTQRQLGVATAPDPAVKPGKDGKSAKKSRRPTVRALTMVRRLLKADATAGAASTLATSTTSASDATSTREPGGG